MSKYFIERETIRVPFEDGQWADLKEEMSQADSDYVMNQMAKTKADNGKAEISIDLGRLALMERMVVAWSFDAPVNKDNLSNLRTKYRTLILAKINELTTKASEFSKN